VAVCANCGKVNPDDAQFCMSCANAIAAEHVHEVRKTVSIIFCDVTGSTALGESLDPETLRHVMGRYFIDMRAVIERHGGSVEKFIGDAVMALFGVPYVHEDDALRAVRAATEMLEALAVLNKELQRDRGVEIGIRIGVNTGEVVAGTGDQTVATGDAVNVAARLEQAARPGEILIGEATYALTRDAIVTEAVEPLQLKGKADPVSAYRLRDVTQGVRGRLRRRDSPMVGRSREFALLGQAFDRAVSGRACQLITILGQAGVGKSRLVQEFLTSVGPARVLRGRCLPYGEGITYFPVIEVVKEAAGLLDFDAPEAIEAKVCSILEGEEHQELVCGRVAQLLGIAEMASPEETFWAIRHFIEAIARDVPLLLVFDDIHWGESSFLDLVDHIADWSRDVPILLCCMARPDLLDVRPTWSDGKSNATTISLEPLSGDECGALIGNLLSTAEVQDEVRRRIANAAEGNPLFIEEMLSMLIDDGFVERRGDQWMPARDLSRVTVPPTISALLAARIDRLSPNQRAVLEAASVAGQEFLLGAVREIAPEDLRINVPTLLMSLVRKEFVQRDRSTLPGEDAFRFRHLLIRDAAYEAMPKELRAEQHERFAGWLEDVAGDRVQEQEEILGHHLESAHDYLVELGMISDRVSALGARAAQALGSAARRAHSRGDMAATRNLMRRAVGLLPIGDPNRTEMLPYLAEALEEAGEGDVALRLIDEALPSVRGGDARLEAHLRLARRRVLEDEADWDELAEVDARAAVDVFATTGDEAGQAKAWRMLGFVEWDKGNVRGAETAWRQAIEYADRAGGVTASATDRAWLTIASFFGPEPAQDALRGSQEALKAVKEIPAGHSQVLWAVACLLAMVGSSDDARAAFGRSEEIERDLGRDLSSSHYGTQAAAYVERFAGNSDAEIRALRDGLERWERIKSEKNVLLAGMIARALAEAGQSDEAWSFAEGVRGSALSSYFFVEYLWKSAEATVLARTDRLEQAERLAREALSAVRKRPEFTWFVADQLMVLADVLYRRRQEEEAFGAAGEALERYVHKGIVISAERTRSLLGTIGSG
jgi:class 3 adenylate cyclase/tetratricopeptide (TPR) repeat protein